MKYLILILLLFGCSDGYEAKTKDKCPTCPKPCPKPKPTPSPTPTPIPDECSDYKDPCPVKDGITWQCKKRFVFGANYAWHDFATDFGGLRTWQQKGVAANSSIIDSELADMKVNGVNIVRWWLFPDFRSEAISFDSSDKPIGINEKSTFYVDMKEALRLIEKNDLYVMFVLFSYDNFRPTRIISDVKIRGLYPIANESEKRRSLIENVIRPLAKYVGHNKRIIAWDLINEPEWSMTGKSKYGDPDFECNKDMECMSHEQIESFLIDVSKTLKDESKALITVGTSAMKWRYAWHGLGLDFYQYHIYDWINDFWPYNKTPTEYGINDKPVLIGEWPVNGLAKVSNATLLPALMQYQYAGALAWSVTDIKFGWNENKKSLKDFSAAKTCETSF
jgi:hypothetical protein